MKSITAADISATTPAQLAALRASPPEAYAAWIQAAADLGLLEAQAILGQMLLDGHGMARDPEAALGWFKRAAQADHLMSINMVGRCYENGWGVARDETVAAYWFRLAADRGLTGACTTMPTCCAMAAAAWRRIRLPRWPCTSARRSPAM